MTIFFRIAWTIATLLAVEVAVCGVAAISPVLIWYVLMGIESTPFRLAAMAIAAAPCYFLFALALMPTSALAMRALGWHSPRDATMPLATLDWPLLRWARALAAAHVVRLVSGTLFKATPVWTWYLRLSGARIGRRVYVNSLAVSDYNLLEFGDDVVIGGDAHISGHTVEHGVVRTGAVRLGSHVTIGLGSIVDIGVTIGPHTQLGSLSLAPKGATLAANMTYVGVPARPLPANRGGADSINQPAAWPRQRRHRA